jgi:hypothetical protein
MKMGMTKTIIALSTFFDHFPFLFSSDGTISLEELANFIFPENISDKDSPTFEYEPGIVYDVSRKALKRLVSSVAAQGLDNMLLQELANLSKVINNSNMNFLLIFSPVS